MLLVLIVLLINSGLTTLPYALEPLLTEKNWHLFLPWCALFFAFGILISPMLFIIAMPFLTLKSGIIVGISMFGCIAVLLIKVIFSILAFITGIVNYEGSALLVNKKYLLGIEGFELSLKDKIGTKLYVSPILASRFNLGKDARISCTYLPYLNRIFRITVKE